MPILSVILMLIMHSSLYAEEICQEIQGPLAELFNMATPKCHQSSLTVTPVCHASTPDGYMTLWKVINKMGIACTDNSNFSHNLELNNLPSTGFWSTGVTDICGGYWSGEGQLTLNVAGNNYVTMRTIDTPKCDEQQSKQVVQLCQINPLPITLHKFTSQFNSKTKCIDIHFSTASESNSRSVTIERSKDGRNFMPLKNGDIPSRYPSGGSYNHSDCESKSAGTYYYRLRQNDYDGKEELFKTVAVNVPQATFKVAMYPNPAFEDLNVTIDAFEGTNVLVEIFDVTGKTILKKTVELQQTSLKEFKVKVNGYSSGAYILRVSDKDRKALHAGKFIKL